MVARFARKQDVTMILRNANKLKGRNSPIYINSQFPEEIANRRRIILPVFRMARAMEMQASLNRDRLIIKGKQYTVDNIHKVPFYTSTTAQRQNGSTLAFFGRLSRLSNFHISPFTVNQTQYNCVEQLYQCAKAECAGDERAQIKIMMSVNPGDMKHIGNQVQVDEAVWNAEKKQVMEDALMAKFTQNRHMRSTLLETGECVLAEASRDKFWGCGKHLNQPRVLLASEWEGKNILGELLQAVRSHLMPQD